MRNELEQRVFAADRNLRLAFAVVVMRFLISVVFSETESLVDRFRRWSSKLVRDEKIKGREPVFPKSRLSVRQIGSMLLRADAEDARGELREDYPFLTDEDLEFAPIYVKAYPRVGRPAGA